MNGKTFVLEKFEEKLKEIQSEETADNKYYVFHYDCWKYDYYEEPIIAIISAMIDEIENEPRFFSEEIQNVGKLAGKTVKDVLKAIMGELAQNKIGIDLVELATGILKDYDEEKEQNKDFDSLYGFRKALDTTRRGILEIANNKAVIIVVDELDRCLPTYAIKILERLHHIFHELDNVVVMVSMDKRQLEQSIKALYGDIDVDVYLRKFISFKVHLDNGIADNFISKYESYVSLFRNTEEERINFFFKSIMQGIDMRTQERIFRKAEIIHYMISAEEKMDSSIMVLPVAEGEEVQTACMVALNADGYAVLASKKTGLKVAGMAMQYVDNRNGKNGSRNVNVYRGSVVMGNDGSIKQTDILKKAYVSGAQEVTITDTGSSRAGTILEVDDDFVTVDIREQ